MQKHPLVCHGHYCENIVLPVSFTTLNSQNVPNIILNGGAAESFFILDFSSVAGFRRFTGSR
jgi:hypothetical protein